MVEKEEIRGVLVLLVLLVLLVMCRDVFQGHLKQKNHHRTQMIEVYVGN